MNLIVRLLLQLALAIAPALCLATGDWGPDLLKPKGPHRHHAFCQTVQNLYLGKIPLQADTLNDYAVHVQTFEALRRNLPADAGPVAADIDRLIAVFAGGRDANAKTGMTSFAAQIDPQLAAVEGRISDYIASYCGIRYGDPSYKAGPPGRIPSRCPAWPGVSSALTNNRFPFIIDDLGANYFSAYFNHGGLQLPKGTKGFIDVPLGGRVEFKGEYPVARYFAFHPNDLATDNYPTLRDADLDPDPGSTNPWREGSNATTPHWFTAFMDFALEPPAAPSPNTRYVGYRAKADDHSAASRSPGLIVLLRTYGSALGARPPNFTGVSLPEINVYDADGKLAQHFAACDPYPPGELPPVDETKFPSWPIADFRASVKPRRIDYTSNFGLPIDMLANRDVLYLGKHFSKRFGNVYIVRAKMPTFVAPNLRDPASIREDIAKQVRMFTICSYNVFNGVSNGCIADADIAVDREGYYTLVVSEDQDRPRNATADHGYTWINWGPFIDGQLTWRILLRDRPLLQDMLSAVEGHPNAGFDSSYLPTGAHCPATIFVRQGHQGCIAWDAKHNP